MMRRTRARPLLMADIASTSRKRNDAGREGERKREGGREGREREGRREVREEKSE